MVIFKKGIVCRLEEAERKKEELREKGALDGECLPIKEEKDIIFPLSDSYLENGGVVEGKIVEREFEKKPARKSFTEKLKEILTEEELERVKTSYDIVGDIAIIEIDEELRGKEKEIGKALLESNKNIKTVLRKEGEHVEPYRTQKMVFLAGENKKETVAVENGCRFLVDVERCYYSIRMGNERKRICEIINNGGERKEEREGKREREREREKRKEKILVMFSGIGVYPIVIARHCDYEKIVGVEMNPVAHGYGVKNLKLNKVKNVELYEGDVKKIVPGLEEKFDRIIMPAPKNAGEFVYLVKECIEKGKKAEVNYYFFGKKGDFGKEKEHIMKELAGLKVEFLREERCGQVAPREYRMRIDFSVERQ